MGELEGLYGELRGCEVKVDERWVSFVQGHIDVDELDTTVFMVERSALEEETRSHIIHHSWFLPLTAKDREAPDVETVESRNHRRWRTTRIPVRVLQGL